MRSGLKTYRVVIRTVYYQEIKVEAKSKEDVMEGFNNGEYEEILQDADIYAEDNEVAHVEEIKQTETGEIPSQRKALADEVEMNEFKRIVTWLETMDPEFTPDDGAFCPENLEGPDEVFVSSDGGWEASYEGRTDDFVTGTGLEELKRLYSAQIKPKGR